MSDETTRMRCGNCENEFDVPQNVALICGALGEPMCPECTKDYLRSPEPEDAIVAVRESKYRYPEGAREISGFGGGYEQTCRNMVIAGMEWFDANPDADPMFSRPKDIVGLTFDQNDDARSLSKALVDASLDDCTGAMHQYALMHVFRARKIGWERYCEEMCVLRGGDEDE